MSLICLVRHGQASFGAADYDALSELGRGQAHRTGLELARRGLRDPLVVSGTLRRQRDTAALLAAAAGYSGSPGDGGRSGDGAGGGEDARWNEYDHLDLVRRHVRRHGEQLGDAGPPEADHSAKHFQRHLDAALAAWIGSGPAAAAGEPQSWAAFSSGAVDALQAVRDRLPPGRDAVVVTSGGVIAAVAAWLLRAPAEGVVALNRVMVNGAVTTVLAGAAGLNLLSFNDHAHFAGDRRRMLTYR